jgi:hypothetical protein
VLQRVGSVAYKLDLPPSSTIHPIFHVSQLKQAIGSQEASPELPQADMVYQIPKQILQRCLSDGEKPQVQGLVKRSSLPKSLATRENLESLRQQFPKALLWKQYLTWGQVVAQEEGDVSASPPVDQDADPLAKRTPKPNP